MAKRFSVGASVLDEKHAFELYLGRYEVKLNGYKATLASAAVGAVVGIAAGIALALPVALAATIIQLIIN